MLNPSLHKGQQDALLGAVEKGFFLIGEPPKNPSFEVNSAILSHAKGVKST
jgi:replication-associated recombination protein RarA